jgi:outer membrane protein, heavy metal efflux system
MNSQLRVVLWACLMATQLSIAHAQETGVSVSAVYQLALENNPTARAQAQRIEALSAGRAAANNLTAGPLTLEGSYRSDRNFDNQGLRETELGVSAPIWLWNERSKNQQYRQAELQAAEHRFAEFKLKLAGQVRQIYWNTLAAQQDVDIAQARLNGASKLMEDVQRRVDAGDLARVDLLQATALHAQAKTDHSRADRPQQGFVWPGTGGCRVHRSNRPTSQCVEHKHTDHKPTDHQPGALARRCKPRH